MERDWLAAQLESGRSIEAIAAELGRHPSTVAYWVNEHGLVSRFAAKHAPKRSVAREDLEALVDEGLTLQQLSERLGVGSAAVRHWLRKFGLRTVRAGVGTVGETRGREVVRSCRKHGFAVFVISARGDRYRCKRCRAEQVSARRRRVKEILIREAGGCCRVCGYCRYAGALQFHHLEPDRKALELSAQGVARSLEKARAEVAKCILLCANCHAEVEAGVATIRDDAPPVTAERHYSGRG
jgi:transposase-like protein